MLIFLKTQKNQKLAKKRIERPISGIENILETMLSRMGKDTALKLFLILNKTAAF